MVLVKLMPPMARPTPQDLTNWSLPSRPTPWDLTNSLFSELTKIDGAVLLFDAKQQRAMGITYVSDLERDLKEARCEYNADHRNTEYFGRIQVAAAPLVVPDPKKSKDEELETIRSSNTLALMLALAKASELVLERRDNIPTFNFKRFQSQTAQATQTGAIIGIGLAGMLVISVVAVVGGMYVHVVGGAMCAQKKARQMELNPTASSAAAVVGAMVGPWYWMMIGEDFEDE
eukprot:CAMPEP_0175119818 /NCGR_PEP_ID=MMETSP0087-20121206/276_1 /TAXON_ID=136419 /ORGANISM="Unknown Unknown, Strain D1" /LENGTH=230 /DNA_ID=CAMNT_0016401195 /DNA_START=604 /DNA_END=1296 /DNA_ORIENTATION=+